MSVESVNIDWIKFLLWITCLIQPIRNYCSGCILVDLYTCCKPFFPCTLHQRSPFDGRRYPIYSRLGCKKGQLASVSMAAKRWMMMMKRDLVKRKIKLTSTSSTNGWECKIDCCFAIICCSFCILIASCLCLIWRRRNRRWRKWRY